MSIIFSLLILLKRLQHSSAKGVAGYFDRKGQNIMLDMEEDKIKKGDIAGICRFLALHSHGFN